MAWETLAAIAAEIKSPAEARHNRLGYAWTYGQRDGADDKHTGDFAAYRIGRATGLGASFVGVEWTSMRVGHWFKTEGFFPGSTHVFFLAYDITDNYLGTVFYVIMNWDTYKIQMVSYNPLTAITTLVDECNDVTPISGNINDWKHISLYLNNSTNSAKFWVNGELLLSGAPAHGLSTIQYVYVADGGYLADLGGYLFSDDLYFDYSTSSEVDDTPPARRYYPALPDGAGTYTNWDPDTGNNYERVDDPSDPDNDTSYVTTDTDANVDTYTFAALSSVVPEANPESALVQAYVRTSPIDGGIAKLKFTSRLAATDVTTSAQRIRRQQSQYWVAGRVYLDWTVLTGYFDTRPGLGGEWTEADFNNAEFGIESDGII